jgi:ATP-dependent Clp protease ATP-binding subunit ClpA
LIENEIARVLADDVLFGKLTKGGKVKVDLADDKLVFDYGDIPADVTDTLA